MILSPEEITVSITRREFLGLPMETRRRILAEQAAQLAHRDSPDREKIARAISEFSDWDGARQYIKDGWLHKADQIIALFPDIEQAMKQERLDNFWLMTELRNKLAEKDIELEQAKREERERIGKIIDSFMAHGEYKVVTEEGLAMRCLGGDVEYIWKEIKQALKEEK